MPQYPLLNFPLLWLGQKCPARLRDYFTQMAPFNPKALGRDAFSEGVSYLNEDPPDLDLFFQYHQKSILRHLAETLFPRLRPPEGESLWDVSGETLREIGWMQAAPFAGKATALAPDNWKSLLPGLPGLRGAGLLADQVWVEADFLFHNGKSWIALLVAGSFRLRESLVAEAELLRWAFSKNNLKLDHLWALHPRESYVRSEREVEAPDAASFFDVFPLNLPVKHMVKPFSQQIGEIFVEALRAQPCAPEKKCAYCTSRRTARTHEGDPPDEAHAGKTKSYPLRTLHRGGRVVQMLEAEGIHDLREIPRATEKTKLELKERHLIQVRAVVEQKAQIDKKEIRTFLRGLRFPLVFIDFESTSEALSPFPGARVWEHLPFLVSLHRIESETAPLDQSGLRDLLHRFFMIDPDADRLGQEKAMVREILAACEGCGSLVAYGSAFESSTLSRLADRHPAEAEALRALVLKLEDMQTPFSHFWYYHPDQQGKTSLKKLLKLTGTINHGGLKIQSGGEANLHYYFLSKGDRLPESLKALYGSETKGEWLENLKNYCAMDTLGLAVLYLFLRHVSRDE